MEEQLISFETAKLAKEKRFHEPCLYYFSLEGDEKEFIEDGYYFKSLGEKRKINIKTNPITTSKVVERST